MGNHADPENIVALANRPLGNGELSDDAIRHLIDSFYAKVRADPELGPIFHRAIPNDWGPHLATMRDFWSAVMLTSGRYKGNPVAVHLRVEGIEPRLFARWLQLFNETCRELFDDDVADVFRVKAARIAESLKLALSTDPTGHGRERAMTFVVTDNCIKCKFMDCMEVCPVDCFYEGEICSSSIPMSASTAAVDLAQHRGKRDPPADAKEFDGVPNKLERFFSPNPGQGDAMNDDDRRSTTAQLVNAEHSSQGQEP